MEIFTNDFTVTFTNAAAANKANEDVSLIC